MAKLEINIDEHWPVFTLDKPKNEDGPWVVEVNDDFYKEYLYFSYKYHEYQTRLQLIYEHHERSINEKLGYRFPEGTECCRDFKLNTIRAKPTEGELPALLSESNA